MKKALPTSKTTSNPLGIKRSGAGNQMSGAQVDAQVSMGLKARQLKGAQVEASLTINQSRPETTN
jgi:hypothetical protein